MSNESSGVKPAAEPCPSSVDVVVIGLGPVGKMAALLLGRRGHTVLGVERQESVYPLPRAAAMDAEIARILQHAGLPVDSMPDAVEPYDDMYVWVTKDDEPLHVVDWTGIDPSGWHNEYFFNQPSLERYLDEALRALPNVQVRRRANATLSEQSADSATVVVTELATGAAHEVEARYVLAADGARSATRQDVGIEWHDLGYFFDWLVVDVLLTGDLSVSNLAKQVCDPARPTTAVPGGPGRRRWEFMRLEGETAEELTRPERIWELLAPFWGVTSDNAEIERGVVYTFNSGWAQRWREGRVLLVGDAAHQMPPFAGQGLASGFRDCVNLAWKLDLVLRGRADDALLDTYEAERTTHVADFIDFSMSLGRIICITDPEAAAARDAAMLAELASGGTPEPPPLPRLGDGAHTGDSGGYLSWQGLVTTADHPAPVRFDDVFGAGALVLADDALAEALDPQTLVALEALDVTVTSFGAGSTTTPDRVRRFADVNGTYAEWLGGLGARAVLVRPDFYVFGSTDDAEGVAALARRYLELVRTQDDAVLAAAGEDERGTVV